MNELELERRLCVVEDRSKSNSHRLRAVEEKQDAMTDLVQSVAAMAQKQVDMDADLKEIKADVKSINLKPAKRWDNVIDKALLAAVGALVAYIAVRLGLQYCEEESIMKNSKLWWKAALVRAAKTVAQTAVATIGTTAVMDQVNWLMVGSASLLAGMLSLLTSIGGLPEVEVTA